MTRYIWAIAAVAGAVGLAVGLSQGHWGIVLRWAGTLCTSCIGLAK